MQEIHGLSFLFVLLLRYYYFVIVPPLPITKKIFNIYYPRTQHVFNHVTISFLPW